MNIEQQAAQAMEAGEIDRTPCGSKQQVLDKIADDEADAMTVGNPVVIGETMIASHTAIRFHDRELGAKVRTLTMRGFNIQPKTRP